MDNERALTIIRELAAQAPLNWDNRCDAIDAVKHLTSELSVLASLRAAQSKNDKTVAEEPKQST